jgi:hypothetical protein
MSIFLFPLGPNHDWLLGIHNHQDLEKDRPVSQYGEGNNENFSSDTPRFFYTPLKSHFDPENGVRFEKNTSVFTNRNN